MANQSKVEPHCPTDAVTAKQGPRIIEAAFESLGTNDAGHSQATASSSAAVNSAIGRFNQESQAQGFRPSEPQSQKSQPSPKREPPRYSYVFQGLTIEHLARSESSSQPHSLFPSTPGPSEPTAPTKAEEQNQCIICYEPFSSRSTLMPCGHEVDFKCVLTWLKECYKRRNNRSDLNCPLCRGEVKSIQHDHKPDGTFSTYDVPSGIFLNRWPDPLYGSQPGFHVGDLYARLSPDPVGLNPWTGHNNLPPPDTLTNLEATRMHISQVEASERHRNSLQLQREISDRRWRGPGAAPERYRQRELLITHVIGDVRESLERIVREDHEQAYHRMTEREASGFRQHHQQDNEELEATGERISTNLDLRHLRPIPTVSPREVQRTIPEMVLYHPNDESNRPRPRPGGQAAVRDEQRLPLRRDIQNLDNMPNPSAYLETWQHRRNEIPTGWTRNNSEEVTGAFGANRDSQRVLQSSGVEPSASRLHLVSTIHSWWQNSGLRALYRVVRGSRGSRHEPGERNLTRSQEGAERQSRSDRRSLAIARP